MTPISNNYPILNKNYSQMAQNACAPAFRQGENPLPAQTIQPSQLSYPPDTVEISAKDKIQNQQKEKGMSTATKIGLAVVGGLATTYACVVGHRMLTKPSIEKVTQNFSEIFRRDISKDEAQNLAKRYKEIFEIKDSEEFTRTLFNQVKKDYGYEKANLPLTINYMTGKETLSECMKSRAGGFHFENCYMVIDLPIVKGANLRNRQRKELLDTFYHEFRHMQQTELCYRSNPSKFLEALEKNAKKDAGNIDKEIKIVRNKLNSKSELIKLANCLNRSVDDVKKSLELQLKLLEKRDETALVLAGSGIFDKKGTAMNLERCFKDVPLRENMNEFKTDIDKFMENSANYLNGRDGMKAYKAQPLEADAFRVSNMAKQLYDFIFMKG